MTYLYWATSVIGASLAARGLARLRQDRSLVVVLPVLCTAAMATAMAISAACPLSLQPRTANWCATWVATASGLVSAWTFAAILSAAAGRPRPRLHLAVPAGIATASALARSVPGAAPPSTAISQMLLLAGYFPACTEIARLSWRYSCRMPAPHMRAGMRTVSIAAMAEIVAIAVRALTVAAWRAGSRAGSWPTEVSGAGMALATIMLIAGATAAVWWPAARAAWRRAWLWYGYWRLRPLWASLVGACPEVRLPPQRGTRWNARFRLHRVVIEIRDAELVLCGNGPADLANARSTLPGDDTAGSGVREEVYRLLAAAPELRQLARHNRRLRPLPGRATTGAEQLAGRAH